MCVCASMYVRVLVFLAQYDACTGLHVGVLVLVCHAVCRQVKPSVCLCARVCVYMRGGGGGAECFKEGVLLSVPGQQRKQA